MFDDRKKTEELALTSRSGRGVPLFEVRGIPCSNRKGVNNLHDAKLVEGGGVSGQAWFYDDC